jgi:NAD-dependent dihydropyrimidine dehydrogenase PreA subunit
MTEKINRKVFFRDFISLIRAAMDNSAEISASYTFPPGSKNPNHFREKCTRCYCCISVCPHEVLQVNRFEHSQDYGLPVILVEEKRCLNCTDYPCISACNGEVLQWANVHIPLARASVDRSRCLNHQGTYCQACINACLQEKIAIARDNQGYPSIDPSQCNGCGACIQACPANPPAINLVMDHLNSAG